ncbi:MAG: hypothetical protein ACI90V_007748, partial [Bacillariaceae sp.]
FNTYFAQIRADVGWTSEFQSNKNHTFLLKIDFVKKLDTVGLCIE